MHEGPQTCSHFLGTGRTFGAVVSRFPEKTKKQINKHWYPIPEIGGPGNGERASIYVPPDASEGGSGSLAVFVSVEGPPRAMWGNKLTTSSSSVY